MKTESTGGSDERLGLFQVRRRRGHPWLAARVDLIADRLYVTIDGIQAAETWPKTATKEELYAEAIGENRDPHTIEILRIWLWGQRVDTARYHYLLSHSVWARNSGIPQADPNKRIDLTTIPLDMLLTTPRRPED